MHRLLDVLASGVHDAKNQLFMAESLLAAEEARHGIDLGEARYAIEAAAERLTRTLAAYHLLRKGAFLAVMPTVIGDLCSEVALAQERHLARSHIELDVVCPFNDAWPLDRDLVADILNNAVQNAGRHARRQVRLEARIDGQELVFCVEDDGPGYAKLGADLWHAGSTGLLVAARLAGLHERHGRRGSLRLENGGALGGAVFELRLP